MEPGKKMVRMVAPCVYTSSMYLSFCALQHFLEIPYQHTLITTLADLKGYVFAGSVHRKWLRNRKKNVMVAVFFKYLLKVFSTPVLNNN